MSRHRDIRSMNYSDEYDGYDDVYGHSVEDDYCTSPGAEQFMYDRNKQQNIASFITEPDIKEDNEEEEEESLASCNKKPELSELDTAKLNSCIEIIRNVLGDTIPEAELNEKILKHNFNAEAALDDIFKSSPKNRSEMVTPRKDRGMDSQSGSSAETLNSQKNSICTPKLFGSKTRPSIFSPKNSESKTTTGFSSLSDLMANHKPNISSSVNSKSSKFNSLAELMSNHCKIQSSVKKEDENDSKKSETEKKPFSSLAEMTAHHLHKTNNLAGQSIKTKPTFVIPKFSTKIPNSPSSPPIIFKSEPLKKKIETSSNVTLTSKINHNVKESNHEIKKIKENEDESSISSQDWIIDLTTALRPLDSSLINYNKNTESKELDKQNLQTAKNIYDMKGIYKYTAEPIPSSLVIENIDILECSLNSEALRYTKLAHSRKISSLFGKMLCRKWKIRKPYIKPPEPEFNDKIKRFDFSSPSPDNLILSNLKR